MKIDGCGRQWADCTPSMGPGPLGAGRLLEQARAIHVIAQLPDEVESLVLRVTRTLMTASPSLIVLAGWHIEGHASFKLRVARQRVKVPPYVADLRCGPFARTQAEDGAGRASKAVQPHDKGKRADPQQPFDQIAVNRPMMMPLMTGSEHWSWRSSHRSPCSVSRSIGRI